MCTYIPLLPCSGVFRCNLIVHLKDVALNRLDGVFRCLSVTESGSFSVLEALKHLLLALVTDFVPLRGLVTLREIDLALGRLTASYRDARRQLACTGPCLGPLTILIAWL